ncbi:hypothetical protein [Sporosarcina limicola]|uniref:Coproporphyrinogen III oxidase n=1 Tax=Sporosarcina limicola TaxID=34101 RepID=A0A927MLW2_9BACL|nr:hypothetical protein [Sporosarcina limicola]MBE1557135.1 hypothetical protein [Sporosarcina limicola]
MNHEFYLIANTTDVKDFWMYRENNNNVIDSIEIHDDLIQYIYDSLEWIHSKNPGLRGTTNGQGINYHGVTLFDKQSSVDLLNIFSSWRDLIKNAPATFELTGKFFYDEEGKIGREHEKLVFNRDEVIKLFEKMILMSRQLDEGNLYLYHCGI